MNSATRLYQVDRPSFNLSATSFTIMFWGYIPGFLSNAPFVTAGQGLARCDKLRWGFLSNIKRLENSYPHLPCSF
jgi:hypothetical protein